jgi:hypothetical protein
MMELFQKGGNGGFGGVVEDKVSLGYELWVGVCVWDKIHSKKVRRKEAGKSEWLVNLLQCYMYLRFLFVTLP